MLVDPPSEKARKFAIADTDLISPVPFRPSARILLKVKLKSADIVVFRGDSSLYD